MLSTFIRYSILFCSIFSGLLSEPVYQPCIGKFIDDEKGIAYTPDKKHVLMWELIYQLDFSEDLPEMEYFRFLNNGRDYYKNIKSDLGLSKNINLKQLEFFEEGMSILRFAKLPSVESLKLRCPNDGLPYQLSFIEKSVPCLKSIEILFAYYPRNKPLAPSLQNISKLPYLENISLSTNWGMLDFTDKEFKAMANLRHLKNLTISLGGMYDYELSKCQELEIKLQSILPDTSVNVIPTKEDWDEHD